MASYLPLFLIVCFMVNITVLDRHVVSGENAYTVIIEDTEHTYYYKWFYNMWMKTIPDECKVYLNQVKPGTVLNIAVDPMNNILS